MDKFKVIYGSSTGNTERAARKIAAALGVEALNVANATSADFDAELLIIGSSTWGLGELQDDWSSRVHLLTPANLQGKRVAVFGTGDQSGFSDTFCDAIGILATRAEEAGALLIGQTSATGYLHTSSLAERAGFFCGLALDDDNQPEKTAGRITAWVEQLRSELK